MLQVGPSLAILRAPGELAPRQGQLAARGELEAGSDARARRPRDSAAMVTSTPSEHSASASRALIVSYATRMDSPGTMGAVTEYVIS